MSQCDRINNELIPLYWDGELTSEEVTLVEQHIKTCEDCRFSFDIYREIHDELVLDDIQPPANFHEELVQKLYLQKETVSLNAYQKSFFVRYIRYINIAALFAVIAFIGLSTLNRPMKETMTTATYDTASTMSEESVSVETVNEAAISDNSTDTEALEAPAQAKMMVENSEDSVETAEASDSSSQISESAIADSSVADIAGSSSDTSEGTQALMIAQDIEDGTSENSDLASDTLSAQEEVRPTSPTFVGWIADHIGLSLLLLLAVLFLGVYMSVAFIKKQQKDTYKKR